MSIAMVISILIVVIILFAIYWVITVKLAPLLGEPIGRFVLIAFFVIVVILLLGLLTGQVAFPKFF